MAQFEQRYGPLEGHPLVVVIAAYNEEGGIGHVVQEVPKRCGHLPVTVLVVVDGASDSTAAVAAEAGAYVCDVEQNRGQGAALRLGYHLAHRMGAQYVVSTDADGQYDSRELPQLMTPLFDGSADFVTGSRRLGTEQTNSPVRWVGVRVFAWLASLLTLRHITDTSFGFRATLTDRVVRVPLREPQYQSSELLIGMLARGARLRELPLSMRLRSSGTTKKGRNLVYGANYARVMISTWWRDFVRRPKP
nr:glycosyltransferase family 2 protein [Brevibacterium daeguense]